jgi:RNA recognition motif-containing protein
LDVKQFKKSSDVEQERAACLSRKVHVKGLPLTCDKLNLTAAMAQFGPVDKAFVMYSHKNGSSRGFGFVEFRAQASVDRAVSASEVKIQGKQVKITRACPKDMETEAGDPRLPSGLQGVLGSPIKSDHTQQQSQIKQIKQADKSYHVSRPRVSGDFSPSGVANNQKKAGTSPNSEVSSALSTHSLNVPPKCPVDASFYAFSAIISAHLERRWTKGEIRFNVRKPVFS